MTRALVRVRRSAGWAFSVAALAAALLVLASIFFFVVAHAAPAIRPALLFSVTSGTAGGLANPIAGTAMLVVLGACAAAFTGIGTGICLAEFAGTAIRSFVRFLVDILAGVPSIVIGYFGYVLLVKELGWGFSWAGGSLALAIIMLPYIVRGTDLALEGVPAELREGAFALGATPTTVFRTIAWPYALPGILTMLSLATGIALGETAPLIYTAGWSNYMPTLGLVHDPIPYLTYVIWTYIDQPFTASHELAYAAATVLIVAIVLTNVVARLFLDRLARRQHGER